MFSETDDELIQKSNSAWKTLSKWWSDDIGDGDPLRLVARLRAFVPIP